MKKIAIIGAGAAGCFCAVQIKRRMPDCEVTVYEAGPRPMAKLALTGGGRCNITNTFEEIGDLKEVYPRGAQLLRRAFYEFGPEQTMRWWEEAGVPLFAQEDGRVFPKSQDAADVVRTLEKLMKELGISLVCDSVVDKIEPGFTVSFKDGRRVESDAVVLTAGGSSADFLRKMLPDGVEVVPTVPSLFTFKIADAGLRCLMGMSVPDAALSIPGTSFRSRGSLLITDWGISGPAALKLSSYAARHLYDKQYRSAVMVDWLGRGEKGATDWLAGAAAANPSKFVHNVSPDGIPERLWRHIAAKAGIREDLRWSDLGGKAERRLACTLSADEYAIEGRAAFKEEFVTCGGVSLQSVNAGTLECKSCKGLFFAGEVLDIDAVTGGFNLQCAWTTAALAAQNILS